MRFHVLSLVSASLGLASLASAAGSPSICTYAGGKLTGCPDGTVYVKTGDIAALQRAFSSKSVPAVLVAPGTYKGQLLLDRPKTVIGEGAVTFQFAIVHDLSRPDGKGNAEFATLNIMAKGRVDMYNIIIENIGDNGQGKSPLGPSLALSVAAGANVAMYGCTLKSWQDTVNINGQLYMRGGAIYGWVDQIYGEGSTFLQNVALKIRGCGGGIMVPRGAKGGVFVANKCSITRASDARPDATNCALARPWDSQAHAIYIKCEMDDKVVSPEGWAVWIPNDTHHTAQTFFREYQTKGNTDGRNKLGRFLTDAEAAKYSNPKNVVPSVVVA